MPHKYYACLRVSHQNSWAPNTNDTIYTNDGREYLLNKNVKNTFKYFSLALWCMHRGHRRHRINTQIKEERTFLLSNTCMARLGFRFGLSFWPVCAASALATVYSILALGEFRLNYLSEWVSASREVLSVYKKNTKFNVRSYGRFDGQMLWLCVRRLASRQRPLWVFLLLFFYFHPFFWRCEWLWAMVDVCVRCVCTELFLTFTVASRWIIHSIHFGAECCECCAAAVTNTS